MPGPSRRPDRPAPRAPGPSAARAPAPSRPARPAPAAEIWVLRHSDAAPEGPAGDGARPLTVEGAKQAVGLGSSLASRGLRARRVLASPLMRARQTASLVAGMGLAPGVPVETETRLAPGGDARGLAAEALRAGRVPALLVGHNPDLESLVRGLTGQAVSLGQGTFVRISFAGGKGKVVERV